MNNEDFVAALDRAKKAERERCAKIADRVTAHNNTEIAYAARAIADEIRLQPA